MQNVGRKVTFILLPLHFCIADAMQKFDRKVNISLHMSMYTSQ